MHSSHIRFLHSKIHKICMVGTVYRSEICRNDRGMVASSINPGLSMISKRFYESLIKFKVEKLDV